MHRKNILPGVNITKIKAEKFKRSRISIYFTFPSVKQTATANALLPAMLTRGFRECSNMKDLSIKLAKLYGASFIGDTAVKGANRVINFTILGIKDEFALNGENLTQEYTDILMKSIFDPVLIDGLFSQEIFDIEKDKLEESLKSEINSKRTYCIRQAYRKFYKQHPSGIEKDGYLDQLKVLTLQDLKDAYNNMLETAQVEVIVAGANSEIIEKTVFEEFSKVDRNPSKQAVTEIVPVQKAEYFEEEIDAVQGKLCLIFTANKKMTSQEFVQFSVAVAMLGGLPTSRLFMNVREKLSLCYYCAANYSQDTYHLIIDSGIEHKNAEKTQKAILKEYDNLINGAIEDEEIDDTKRALICALDNVDDSISKLEQWHFSQISRDTNYTPKDIQDIIKQTTKQQIKDALKQYSLSVVYTLTQQKGE